MGRRADGGRRAEWVARLQEYESSGLTVAEFCGWLGVSVATFYNWRRRLADESGSLGRQSTRGVAPSTDAAAFLPVRVITPPRSAPSLPSIEIQLPNGVRILVPLGEMATVTHALRDILMAASSLPSETEDITC